MTTGMGARIRMDKPRKSDDVLKLTFRLILSDSRVGYCYIDFNSTTKEAGIVDFVLDSSCQKRGYGKKFWNMIESRVNLSYSAKKYSGEISPAVDNYEAAANFWKSVGFTVDGINITKMVK